MSEIKNNTDSFDTVGLEEANQTKNVSTFKKIKAAAKRQLFNVRHSFSESCDKSFVSNLFDGLYFKILNCPLKVFGLFLVVMSFVSLVLSYAIRPDFHIFFTHANVFSTIILFLVGMILLTCRKRIGDVLSQSSVFSHLDIVYSQPAITALGTNERKSLLESYSTAFFTGILAGILSILLPSSSIVLFILALCYVVFVFARPECGLLFSLFTLPFFSTEISSFICILTFTALVYKFLRGKRHIDFKIMEGMLICAACYILLRCTIVGFTADKNDMLLQYIAFFLIFLTVISLVRTTSMLRRTISVIISVSRVYAILCLVFYICFVILGKDNTLIYFENLGLPGLVDAITSSSFLIPFLSIAVPLCFSSIFIRNSKEIVKNSIYFIIFLALSSFVSSLIFTMLLVLFSLLVIVMSSKKKLYLLIVAPPLAYGIFRLFGLIPERFLFVAQDFDKQPLSQYVAMFKNNVIFGSGTADSINASSGLLALLYTLGIVGSLIIIILIGMIIYKAVKSVISIRDKNIKISTYSHGLICSSFCFIATTLFFNTLQDFRPVLLFAAVLSLAFTGGRCFDEDYVDPYLLREQTNHN